MNQSWRQLIIHFGASVAAEHTAVAHLGPLLAEAETAGLVASWFFIRKAPFWRVRFLPSGEGTNQNATAFVHQRLLMRGAGVDWYEQGDVWARVSEHRSLPPGVPPDRLHAMQPSMRRLMTVDTTCPMHGNGPLAFLSEWATAFNNASMELGELAGNGIPSRGLRAVLAHHLLFAWNRIGLSHTTQSLLANVAKAVVLDQ